MRQSALIAAAAFRTSRSVGATTPANVPSRTTVTPAIARAPLSSIVVIVPVYDSGRMTFPYIIPGRVMSGV